MHRLRDYLPEDEPDADDEVDPVFKPPPPVEWDDASDQ
jgi:hypothetical protein